MAIIYGLKVNLSVAMVAMVNHTAVKLASSHGTENHGNTLSVFNATSATLIEECEAGNTSSSGGSQVRSVLNIDHKNFNR